MEPGIYDGIDEMLYHADPALSHSGMKTLLDCPARYDWQRRHPRPDKKEFDLGHAAHAKLLGVGLDVVEVQADDWRTKAAKDQAAEARAAGAVPMLTKEIARVDAMVEAVLAHEGARAILDAADAVEQSMWWTCELGVQIRGRVDLVASYADGTPCLVDLKTTTDASPIEWPKTVVKYRYDLQRAVYTDGWRTITGESPDFALIVVEKEPPHLTALYRLDLDFLDRGNRLYEQAVRTWIDCTETGQWPGYGTDFVELSPPGWAR